MISAKALVFARLSSLKFSVSFAMLSSFPASFALTSSSFAILDDVLFLWLTTVCNAKTAVIVNKNATSI